MESVFQQLEKLEICSLCLCQGFKLTPVPHTDDSNRYLNQLVTNWKNRFGCWRCIAALRRFLKLCQVAELSSNTLNTHIAQINRVGQRITINAQSLSKSVTTITDSVTSTQYEIDKRLTASNIQYAIKTIDDKVKLIDNNFEIKEVKQEIDTNFDSAFKSDSDDEVLANLKRELSKEAHRKQRSKKDKQLKGNKKSQLKKERLFKRVFISEEEMLLERERDRTQKWFVQSQFKCESCYIGYYKDQHLKEHNVLKHNSAYKHVCSTCQQRFLSQKELDKHWRGHTVRLECTSCGARVSSHRQMWRHHMLRHGLQRLHSCSLCGADFTSAARLASHRRSAHAQTVVPLERTPRPPRPPRPPPPPSGPPAYCVLCDKHFPHLAQYRRHLKVSVKHAALANAGPDNKETVFSCETCGKKTLSESGLQRHRDVVHLRLHRFQCPLCEKDYATAAALYTHRRNAHERRPRARDFVCHLCGKAFASGHSLQAHSRCHSPLRRFACSLGSCAATFRHRSARYMHLRLAHRLPKRTGGGRAPREDLPLRCSQCVASFRHPSGLYLHARLQHTGHPKPPTPPPPAPSEEKLSN